MKLLETIRFENGRFENLAYHQVRMNEARKVLSGCKDEIGLSSSGFAIRMQGAEDLQSSKTKLFKCRIIYSNQIEKIEFLPYTLPVIKSLKIVFSDGIDYSFKYLDRSPIEKLYRQKDTCDDILIIKNGLVTDTSYANILFFNGKKWITPAHPLLKGTQRAKLLDEEKIMEADIRQKDIAGFKKARLINAMVRFEDEMDIAIENIKK